MTDLENKMHLHIQQKIQDARSKFAQSLVGRWSTAQGTFNAVMAQHWEIRPNGTGCYTDTGPFGAPRSEMRFEWRQSNHFVFELRLTEYLACHPDDAIELEDTDRNWRAIRYDFMIVTTDFGTHVGLIDVSQIGMELAGFLDSLAPLVYIGLIEVQR